MKAGPGIRVPLRPQSLHEVQDMCLGGFTYSTDKLRGVGVIFRATARREMDFPKGLGLPTPPTPLDPSSLPEMNSNVDAIIVMRGSRRRQAAGGPPVVFLLQVAHHAAR